MSQEAFNPLTDSGTGASPHLLFTAGASTAANEVTFAGDMMVSVRSAPCYWRWGRSGTTVTASGTASTQGGWLPQNTLIRMHKPDNATHLILLRDGGTDAQVYVTPGNGI